MPILTDAENGFCSNIKKNKQLIIQCPNGFMPRHPLFQHGKSFAISFAQVIYFCASTKVFVILFFFSFCDNAEKGKHVHFIGDSSKKNDSLLNFKWRNGKIEEHLRG